MGIGFGAEMFVRIYPTEQQVIYLKGGVKNARCICPYNSRQQGKKPSQRKAEQR
jgi:hypothetical protein